MKTVETTVFLELKSVSIQLVLTEWVYLSRDSEGFPEVFLAFKNLETKLYM